MQQHHILYLTFSARSDPDGTVVDRLDEGHGLLMTKDVASLRVDEDVNVQ